MIHYWHRERDEQKRSYLAKGNCCGYASVFLVYMSEK